MKDLINAIQSALAEAKAQEIAYFPLEFAQVMLNSAYAPAPPKVQSGVKYERYFSPACPVASGARVAAPSPKRPPPWYIGLSTAFNKAVVGIDRKLQGRVLEALADIALDPTTPRGDTIKPLNGNLKGCWRYRVGGYRLIYSPDHTTGDITLLTFTARGSAYD